MKKKPTNLILWFKKVPLSLLGKKRLTLLFTFLVILQVGATENSLAQKKVSLSLKNVSLKEFFGELRQQTGDIIVFSNSEINPDQLVSVTTENELVTDILDKVLKELELGYKMMEDYIVIYKDSPQTSVRGKVITGTVTDENNEKLPGVSILIKGVSMGTVTDNNGAYRLTIPEQENIALVFSFVGMKTKEVKYTGKDTINVVMQTELSEVDEVVVTGYQSVKRKAMAGSVSKVDAKDLVMTGTETLEQMLQGKLPGVQIINTSGLTGTRQKVRVRGTSTLVGNADPVWVVDGIIQQDPLPFDSGELTDISDDNMDMIRNFIGGAISWLNPRDIQDITVLKDASATAIYGVRAANGVIIITTKKGERGRLSLNYSTSLNIGERLNYEKLELMNSKQRVDLSREAYERGAQVRNEKIGYIGLALAFQRGEISYNEFNEGAKKLEATNTDWFDILYRTPFSHSHSLSFSGGSENSTYYASVGYTENKNTAKGNEQTSYTGRLNQSSTFWNKLTLNLALSGSHTETKAFASGVDPFNYAKNTNRVIPCYEEDGNLFFYDKNGLQYNILNELKYSGNENRSRSLNLSMDARWIVLDGIILSSTLGGGSTNTIGETWFTERTHHIASIRNYNYGAYDIEDDEFKKSELPYGGVLSVNRNEGFNYTWRMQSEFIKNIGLHSLNLMLGGELSSNTIRSYSQTNYGYMPERGNTFVKVPLNVRGNSEKDIILNEKARSNPNVSKSINNVLSYYFSGSYMYDYRYALNFSIRGDGSNRFGQDEKKKFQPVWSLGLRWNVTDEKWLQDQDLLNSLSLSATYGFQGNVVEAVSPYLIAKMLALDENTGEFKMTYSKLPSPDLKWEKTRSVNLGINFSILRSKINGSFEYYYKKTTDLITNREVPYENGVTSTYINSGDMTNKGWELTFSLVPIRTKDFVWSLGLNTSKVYNKLISNLEPTGDWREVTSGNFNKKGYPVSSFWAFRFTGLHPENGGPLFDLTNANSSDAELDVSKYMVHVGKMDPDLTAGINMNFRYKNWTLSSSFYLSTGNQCFLDSPYGEFNDIYGTYGMPSEYSNASTQLLKRWRQPGDHEKTSIPSIPVGANCLALYPFSESSTALYPYEAWSKSDVRVVDAWYLRCNNINISYTFPDRMVKKFAQHLSLSMSISNPFQIVSKDFDSRDPEVAKGNQPLSRNFSFSLNVSF